MMMQSHPVPASVCVLCRRLSVCVLQRMVRHDDIPLAKGCVREHQAHARVVLASSSTQLSCHRICSLKHFTVVFIVHAWLSLSVRSLPFVWIDLTGIRTNLHICTPSFDPINFPQENGTLIVYASRLLSILLLFAENLFRSTAPWASLCISQVERYMRQGGLILAAGRVRSKKNTKK